MCDCESPSFFRREYHASRRERRCCECRQLIRNGARYESATGKWEGEVDTFATCIRCSALRKAFQDVSGCCSAFGTLFDEIRDSIRDEYVDRESLCFAWRHEWAIATGRIVMASYTTGWSTNVYPYVMHLDANGTPVPFADQHGRQAFV